MVLFANVALSIWEDVESPAALEHSHQEAEDDDEGHQYLQRRRNRRGSIVACGRVLGSVCVVACMVK